ncbi:MAG: OsmC family protein [Chitinophagaceae bacterium]|nr:OsmC family protein [Chitinophagaceae bacterium]
MVSVQAQIGLDHYQTVLTNGRQHRAMADEPADVGGTDTAFAPDEWLAGALASCAIITMRMYADRKQWPVERIELTVSLERTPEGITRFQKQVHFTGNISEEQVQRLLAIGDKCPVHKTLSNPIEILSVIV